MIKGVIIKVVNKGDLSYDEAHAVMNEVMSGESSQVRNAAFLAAISTKDAETETTDEISGCAATMCARAMKVEYDKPTLEIVGADNDGAKAFDVSSISALVAAMAGTKVTKYGNRAASSDCGSTDFLETFDISISQDPELCKKLLNEINICFLFVQHYHASMKYAGVIRHGLGFRTVFNILGPLTNPASPQYFVLGIYDEYLAWPLANVLKHLGVERALVVYDRNKMDEISASTPDTVCESRDGSFHSAIIKPEGFGLQRGKKGELIGGNLAENMRTTREVLSGEERDTCHTAVLLSADATLYIGGKAESLKEGVQLTGRPIGRGRVLEAYEGYIHLSNEAAK